MRGAQLECEKLGSMMQLGHSKVTKWRYPQTTGSGFLELNQQCSLKKGFRKLLSQGWWKASGRQWMNSLLTSLFSHLFISRSMLSCCQELGRGWKQAQVPG